MHIDHYGNGKTEYPFLTLIISKKPSWFHLVCSTFAHRHHTLTSSDPTGSPTPPARTSLTYSQTRNSASFSRGSRNSSKSPTRRRPRTPTLLAAEETFHSRSRANRAAFGELVNNPRSAFRRSQTRQGTACRRISIKNKQLYKSYVSYKDAYKQSSTQLKAINQTRQGLAQAPKRHQPAIPAALCPRNGDHLARPI